MKKQLLLVLINMLCVVSMAQTTAVPDVNFEQALINLGYDTGTPDGIVSTAAIDTIHNLNLNFKNITSLTGIEDFTSLTYLYLNHNQLTSLNITQNLALANLECSYNLIESLDVTQNTNLTWLSCFSNQLSHLDVSKNSNLAFLNCSSNQLTCLNVKNGSNTTLTLFAQFNPNLTCIEVDDVTWATGNWTVENLNIGAISSFSNNCNNTCSTLGISESQNLNLTIYPNPTNGQLKIDTELDISKVIIFDLVGNLVAVHNQSFNVIYLTDLSPGTYYIQLIIDDTTITQRIIKQ